MDFLAKFVKVIVMVIADPYLSEWGEPHGEPGCDMFCGSEKAWGDKRPVYYQDRLCIAHEFNVTLDTCVQIQDQERAKEFCFPGAEYTRRKPCPVNHCCMLNFHFLK